MVRRSVNTAVVTAWAECRAVVEGGSAELTHRPMNEVDRVEESSRRRHQRTCPICKLQPSDSWRECQRMSENGFPMEKALCESIVRKILSCSISTTLVSLVRTTIPCSQNRIGGYPETKPKRDIVSMPALQGRMGVLLWKLTEYLLKNPRPGGE